MEARPTECRAVDVRLTKPLATVDATQARTIAARKMKSKRIIKVMEMIVVKKIRKQAT